MTERRRDLFEFLCPPDFSFEGSSIRIAQTLYSGIRDPGSSAALVRKFAAWSFNLTNGTKTSPGRMRSE